jgi:hypothetical protein
MLHRGTIAEVTEKVVGVLQWTANGWFIAASAASRVDLVKSRITNQSLREFVAWQQEQSWFLLPVLFVIVALLAALRKFVGPSWRWKTIHGYCTVFRDEVFIDHKKSPEYYHRVTLFCRRSFAFVFRRWPWTGWCIPVERSGHTSQGTSALFRASDQGDNSQGVAGRTWATNRVQIIRELPDVSKEAAPSDTDFANYAKASWVEESWVRKKRPSARSILGIPVRAHNRVWGVIVLDSRDPKGVPDDIPQPFDSFAKYIGQLLEGR